jgi:hypothetical protein
MLVVEGRCYTNWQSYVPETSRGWGNRVARYRHHYE